MKPKLFGTDGIRGIANSDLTPELAFRLGEAVVHYMGDRGSARFVVGRDTRRSGTMLQSALIAGITSAGGDVLLAHMIPTPAVSLLVRHCRADGGIVISASHNAPDYNGLKIFSRDGFKLPDELERNIESFLNSDESLSRQTGAAVGQVIHVHEPANTYTKHAIRAFEPNCLAGLRVALDCGHGASAHTSPIAFEKLGAQVTAINTDYTGDDINVECGSTQLGHLQEMMKTGRYDIGIAHDGDADRVLAVDEKGNEVDGDQIVAIIAKYLNDNGKLKGGTVVGTVMSNLGFQVAMKEIGINVIKTRVGDRYVLEAMQTSDANLGGEQSGHIILLDYNTTGDGLLTGLMLSNIVASSETTLSELTKVMTRYPQVLVNVPVRDRDHLAASLAIADAVKEAEAQLGDSGRILVRPSGTERVVRVMAEAANIEDAQRVVDQLVEIVKQELN